MLRRLMQVLGFYGDDDYVDESEDYEVEEQRTAAKRPNARRRDEPHPVSAPRLVFFKGVPSESIKLRLRDALLNGIMVLLDLHELDPREFEEEGRPFINFMGGVAFAHKGRMEYIEPAMYLVTPHEGMFEEWVEEEPLNDGTFDRQGR